MLEIKLTVVGGEMESHEISLRLPATIGRGRDVAVNLSHPLVSRRHCELLEQDGGVLVRDLNSMNGTFVGSQRIQEAPLASGELLTVGTVTFRAHYDAVRPVGELSSGDTLPIPRTQDTARETVRDRDVARTAISHPAHADGPNSTVHFPAPPHKNATRDGQREGMTREGTTHDRTVGGDGEHQGRTFPPPPAGPQNSLSAGPRRPK